MRSARSPCAFSNAALIAGHTDGFAIRLAWHEYWFPALCPASGMHFFPVCVATLPFASTIATCRTSELVSARTRESSACCAVRPFRIRWSPLGP